MAGGQSGDHPIYWDQFVIRQFGVVWAVDIWANGQKQTHEIWLQDEREDFEFHLSSSPDLVLLDPEQLLVGVVEHKKPQKTWEYQYRHAENPIARLSALMNLDEFVPDTLDSELKVYHEALNDSISYIRDWALNHIPIEGTPNKQSYLKKVAKLAEFDSNNEVRSSAMWVLGEEAAADYRMLFKRNLSYPSYQVRGTALMGYVRSQPDDADEIVEQYAEEKDLNLIVAAGR